MQAYWAAAERLSAGQPLYPPVSDSGAADVYRYAPWFAWVWVPLTQLPRPVVSALWSLVLLLASVAAVIPMLRPFSLTALGAAALLLSLLIWSASSGNVQPLIVAAVVHGVERRSGPLWIGFAASLKIVPAILALVYVGRGEWLRALLALGVTCVLWATALTQPLANYPLGSNDSPNPLLGLSPWLYVATVIVVCAAVVLFGRGRYGWLAGAFGTFLAVPRSSLIELTYLCLATPTPRGRSGRWN